MLYVISNVLLCMRLWWGEVVAQLQQERWSEGFMGQCQGDAGWHSWWIFSNSASLIYAVLCVGTKEEQDGEQLATLLELHWVTSEKVPLYSEKSNKRNMQRRTRRVSGCWDTPVAWMCKFVFLILLFYQLL